MKYNDKFIHCTFTPSFGLKFICPHCTHRKNRDVFHAMDSLHINPIHMKNTGGCYDVYKINESRAFYRDYLLFDDREKVTPYVLRRLRDKQKCYNTKRLYIIQETMMREHVYHVGSFDDDDTLRGRHKHIETMEVIKHEIREHFMSRLRGKRAMMLIKMIKKI
jgi:hypothetical protein